MTDILPYIQIILSILLVVVILLQKSEAGLGGAFGGGDGSNAIHYTRRGFEKTLFISTFVLAILFAVTSFVALLI